MCGPWQTSGAATMTAFHELTMQSITGKPVHFRKFRGHHCLVVNVASRCGLTPQYAGLTALQRTFGDRNFLVLGFPCNQFGAQEPGSDAEIAEFACSRYDVDFPMFSKVEVNGTGAAPLFRWLKSEMPDEEGNADIPWNFTKFLVSPEGEVVARYGPRVTPEEIGEALNTML
jgi:glutathione peroxidase